MLTGDKVHKSTNWSCYSLSKWHIVCFTDMLQNNETSKVKHPQNFSRDGFRARVWNLCTCWIVHRIALPPPPTADSHYGCAWAIWANLAKLCGVCLSPADSQLREIKEVKRRIIPGGVVLSCGLPLCQVAQWRDTRTPGQLIKVRCGWMPWVTHDPCSPPPLTTHTASTLSSTL